MKKTKIIFFGTSDRSLPILESLKNNFQLVLCITKKDSKIGRKFVTKEPEVKLWCIKNKIDFIQMSSLKNENLEYILDIIEKYDADCGVVADFSYIIPKKVIDSIPSGIINIHFSLLPKYRGASPIQFAILNGDETTGITYYLLDEKLDTGSIIYQSEYIIDSNITSGELYDFLFQKAGKELPTVLKRFIKKEITPKPQDHNIATYTISGNYPKKTTIFKEDAFINWEDTPIKIERMIRAFDPWPIAWTTLENLEKAKCLTSNIQLKNHVNKKLSVKIFKASVVDEKLQVGELQIEGKNKISWEEFKNGYLK